MVNTAVEVKRGKSPPTTKATISHMVQVALDFDGWRSSAMMYVVPGLSRDAILGLPWMEHRKVILEASPWRLRIGVAGNLLITAVTGEPKPIKKGPIIGLLFAAIVRRHQRQRVKTHTFLATSLREINTILEEGITRQAEELD